MNPDRVRAAIRTLYPDHMTPTAKRVLDTEAVPDGAASSLEDG